jgi:dihydrolipoamide dehydrogenase
MSQHFKIAVLGTGPGGYVAALKAGQMGASTAVVEQHPFFGGTCLNWGCIPSKALLASAQLLHEINRAGDFGVTAGQPSFDWTKIQARKDKILAGNRNGIKSLFAARKVASFQGRAVLDGPNKVVVMRDGQAADSFTADNIILAVGSVPARIPGWPTDTNYVCTSDEALHWKTLPKSLLIIGGGVIGCEFACMMREYGVTVTVVEMMPNFLPGMDCQLAEALIKVFTKRGITCLTGTKVEDMKIADDGVRAVLSNGQTIAADRVLVATGRRPNTPNLGLETVGLSTDRGFVRVDDKMETPAKGVYCIGDANGRILLAHAASAQGVVAVENIMGEDKVANAPVPLCVYTFPEIAAVGMTQDQAKAQGIPVSVGLFPYSHLAKAMTVGDTEGFVKVLRHRETGEMLGVHMMGHNVTECIHAASALLHERVSLREAAEVIMAHPTMSEAIHEAFEDSLGMALHLPPRKVVRVQV